MVAECDTHSQATLGVALFGGCKKITIIIIINLILVVVNFADGEGAYVLLTVLGAVLAMFYDNSVSAL